MRLSHLVTKTKKASGEQDPSRNAALLTKAGYIQRLMSGVYSYLPLGLKVLNNIETIIREEMNALGAQEILMPALQPREIWEKTGRWDKIDVLYTLKGAGDADLALGPTHEEVVTPLLSSFLKSHRDLPAAVYQIQTKYRNEARAKAGLLRGREFRMKDLYSFHLTQDDLDEFYNRTIEAYLNVYRRCGLGDITYLTYATGGAFSKYSHEFQTITSSGEDIIYKLKSTNVAINKELVEDIDALRDIIPEFNGQLADYVDEYRAIEVGNIFKLGTRFSDAFSADVTHADGKNYPLIMGCYGIGSSRIMGTIAEALSDDRGLIWPDEVAPFKVHLVSLCHEEWEIEQANTIYERLIKSGISVLYDDRMDVRAGEKFSDADLLGMPRRVVVSSKTLESNSIEFKPRNDPGALLLTLENLENILLDPT